MSFIIGANSAVAGGFDIDNSCRFDGSSSHIYKTPAGTSDRDKWTWSAWVKRSKLTTDQNLFTGYEASTTYTQIKFDTSDRLNFANKISGAWAGELQTTRKFRDPSAWYHIVCIYDSGNGTAGDRMIMYVNGVRETVFTGTDIPTVNIDSSVNWVSRPMYVGSWGQTSIYFNGYIAEVVFIDGQALAATSFGEFDEDSGIWKPIDVSGLTFGTNGFYLDFKDSANLGNDANGGTDLTEAGLAATDQATDTPTNNFATLNFLDNYYPKATLSEGNLLQVSDIYVGTNVGEVAPNTNTIGVSSGKWYAEMKYVSTAEHSYGRPGITSNQNGPGNGTSVLGSIPGSWGMFLASGTLYNGNGDTATSYGSAIHVGDIVGMYLDLDNNKFYYADNGSLVSSTGISITAAASTNLGAYFFGNSDESRNTATFGWNFGGCSAFTVSSGNTDVNGYGNFEYDPSSGTFDGASKDFLAVCTKNLAEHG